MSSTTSKSYFWQGFRDGAPFILVLLPFSTLFGVVATEAGLNVYEAFAFSVVVIAGAAQFAAIQLMMDNAPTLIVIASALAVNLRMAIYSASLAPYLREAKLWQRALVAYGTVDQSYALAAVKYENEPKMNIAQRLAYFTGALVPVLPFWYGFTVVGALGGKAIPESWAIDFAVPLTFLAMIGPMLRTLPHLVGAIVSIAAALGFAWVPFNLGLLIAAFLAMVAAVQCESWLERRAQT
jgi:predicted branched-subunit amino acid permease